MKHDVRSCGCHFTKYPFQKRKENNTSSFSLLADSCKLCQAGVIQSLQLLFHLKGLLVQHWEVPSRVSKVKTQLKIVFYNFFKKLSSLLTDCALFSTRIAFSTGFYLCATCQSTRFIGTLMFIVK